MTKFFKNRKRIKTEAPVPRQLPEIQDEVNKLLQDAAKAQYLAFVHAETLKSINAQLIRANQEANLRQELDAKAGASNEQP